MASYALADLGAPGTISLAQNESLRPPSPNAIAAGQGALTHGALYPDPDWQDLRSAIAAVHGLDPATLLCGAGSMELIGSLIRAFAGPGDIVLGTQYAYAFLSTAAQQAAADHQAAPEPDLAVSIDAVLDAVTDRLRIFCICNPGNPAGTAIPNVEIVRLRAALPAHVLLLVDQAYAEFDPQSQDPIFALVQRGDTVVTRTLSKAYGLAGARAGWAICPPAIGAEVRKLLNPNNVAHASQAMAAAAMLDQPYMNETVAQTTAIRTCFEDRLRAAGFKVPRSATNFVLIPFADAAQARAADAALLLHSLILRGMGGYGLPHCLRATIGTAAHMDMVADIVEGFA